MALLSRAGLIMLPVNMQPGYEFKFAFKSDTENTKINPLNRDNKKKILAVAEAKAQCIDTEYKSSRRNFPSN